MTIDATKPGHVPCLTCSGVGEVTWRDRRADGGLDGPYPCTDCGGEGELQSCCPRCGGTDAAVLYESDPVDAEVLGCERCSPVYHRGWSDCDREWQHRHGTQTRIMRDRIERLTERIEELEGRARRSRDVSARAHGLGGE